jgi:hypothetical protein
MASRSLLSIDGFNTCLVSQLLAQSSRRIHSGKLSRWLPRCGCFPFMPQKYGIRRQFISRMLYRSRKLACPAATELARSHPEYRVVNAISGETTQGGRRIAGRYASIARQWRSWSSARTTGCAATTSPASRPTRQDHRGCLLGRW